MWKRIQETDYFINFNDDFGIYVTDFNTLWSKKFSHVTFLDLLKKCNWDIDEIDDHDLLDKGKKMLLYPDDLKSLTINVDGTTLCFFMVSNGLPIILELKLDEGSKDLYFQKVTQQLLKTIRDLRESEIELCDLLKNKDIEIKAYQNGEIKRSEMTKPFNEVVHLSKHTVYEANFGSSVVPDDLLDKVIIVANEEITVKQEPTVKEESAEKKIVQPVVKKESEDKKIVPPVVKVDADIDIKQETIKIEHQSDSNSNTVSPRNKRKRKLNI